MTINYKLHNRQKPLVHHYKIFVIQIVVTNRLRYKTNIILFALVLTYFMKFNNFIVGDTIWNFQELFPVHLGH